MSREERNEGCQVLGGVGCAYKPEAAWCPPCKRRAAREKIEGIRKNETWGERDQTTALYQNPLASSKIA